MTQSRVRSGFRACLKPSVALKEHFSALALQIREWAADRDGVRTLGVVGDSRGVGASTVAFNLASALADQAIDRQVILVEANFGNSHSLRSPATGLCEIISQQVRLEDCLVSDDEANLSLLPFGRTPPGAAVGLPWTGLVEGLGEGFKQFDLAIFDLASLDQLESCLAIASQLDGLILVSEHGRAREQQIGRFRSRLAGCTAELLGRVVNKSSGRQF